MNDYNSALYIELMMNKLLLLEENNKSVKIMIVLSQKVQLN